MRTETNGWVAMLKLFCHRRVVTMLFLGFSAGIPLLLIFSSLSLWLREAGAERAAVLFSLVESCRRLGLNPHEYLTDVLTRLPETPLNRCFCHSLLLTLS